VKSTKKGNVKTNERYLQNAHKIGLLFSLNGQMGEKTAIFGHFPKGLVISRLCFRTFSKVFPYGARRPVLPTKTTCFAH
jgi:hypothetical protein